MIKNKRLIEVGMLGEIIFFIFIIGLVRDYNKWVCLTVILLVFLWPINLWGRTFPNFLGPLVCFLFPFKARLVGIKEKFPLKIPMVLLSVAYLLSNYYSTERHNGTMVTYILNNCILIWVFFYVFLKDKERLFPFFMKTCVVLGAIVGFYSVFETLTNSNPIMKMLINNNWVLVDNLITGTRYGVKRSQGIFTMHGTNGAFAIELLFVLYGGLIAGYIKKTFMNYLIIFSLLFTVFVSGTRSAILALIICSFMLVNRRMLDFRRFFGGVVVILVFYVGFQEYFNMIINSFVDTESIGGSNTSMREGQLEIAIMYFLKSPIYGNGIQYCGNNVMGVYQEMYGAESLWFPAMIDTGLLGVIGYALFFFYSIKYCIKNGSMNISFFVLGFFVLNTMSSIPGLTITWIFPFLLVLMEIGRKADRRIVG